MYGLPICDLEDDTEVTEDSKKGYPILHSGLPENKEFSYRVTVKGAPEG